MRSPMIAGIVLCACCSNTAFSSNELSFKNDLFGRISFQSSCSRNLRFQIQDSVIRLRGGRKGVSAKHTSAEIARKTAEATTNKGGGKAGLLDRLGGSAGHAKFVCPLCKMQAPSIKNMQEHHESKHDGIPFNPEACENAHLVHGGTTKGLGVHGTLRKAKVKAKEKKAGDDSD